MKNTFNLHNFLKLSQDGSSSVDPSKIIKGKPGQNPAAPVPSPSPAYLNIEEAVEKAKRVYTENSNDEKKANLIIENEIRSKLDEKDKKKFDDEIIYFFSRKYLRNLVNQAQDENPSEKIQELIHIFQSEGPADAEYFLDNIIKAEEPKSYDHAKRIFDAMQGNRFDINNISSSSSNAIDESLNLINHAAAEALERIINGGMVSKWIEECGPIIKMLSTPTGKIRFKSAMESFAQGSRPLFDRNDLFGVPKDRSFTLISLFISQHSESMRTSGSRIIQGPLHDFVNRHFNINPKARPLGDAYEGSGQDESPAVVSRRHFDEIDGGLHAHRLPDGKYSFQHICEEFSQSLSQDPPDQRALCIVFYKISLLAESQGQSGGKQFSQMGDAESGGPDFSGSGYESQGGSESVIPSTTISDPGQPRQILEAVRSKTDSLRSLMSQMINQSNMIYGSDNPVTQYFLGAIERLAAAAANTENWLAGNAYIEENNNGMSPYWVKFIDYPRVIQINQNKEKILENQNFGDLGRTVKKRNIAGIETSFIFDYERPSSYSLYSKKTIDYSDPSGKKNQVRVPIYKTKFVDVVFKDKIVSPADFTVSQQDVDVLKQIEVIVKPSTMLERNSKTDAQKIEEIVAVFKSNPASFAKGASTLKSNINASIARLSSIIGVRDEAILESIKQGSQLIGRKEHAPDLDKFISFGSTIPQEVFLRLLIAVVSKIGQRHKALRNFSSADNKTVMSFLKTMLDQGSLTKDQYDALIAFKASPQTATASKTAEEIEAWIKVMKTMIFS